MRIANSHRSLQVEDKRMREGPAGYFTAGQVCRILEGARKRFGVEDGRCGVGIWKNGKGACESREVLCIEVSAAGQCET